jgi:DNA polymerase-4
MSRFLPSSELKWLFFDLNSYFASVEQQDRPELRGKPIAVVPMMTDSTCAIAASYEAKAYGIKTGTKIYEAKRLCPHLQCIPARHDIYVDYHHRVFDELENHLHVTKVCSIDEAACQLLGSERQSENAVKLAHKIKAGICENVGSSIRCSIGIASNAYLAKIATEMQKPDGLVVLEPNNYKHKLFKLKLRDLTGINVNMERRLNKSGVSTVEQFWNLSPKHARKIWGSVGGERFWYKLHGYDVPDRETQKSVVGHSRVLDPAIRNPEKAYAITNQLTVKAATRLRRYGLYARRFSLQVRTMDRMRWTDDCSFAPTQDNFTFIKTLEDMWQRMLWDTGNADLMKVSISIYDLYKPEEVTLDLFDTRQPQPALNNVLSETMDTINKRYGANAIHVGSCPKTSAGYVGTKIAFTRVPEKAEF